MKRGNTVEQYQYDKDGNQIALNTTSGNTEYRYKSGHVLSQIREQNTTLNIESDAQGNLLNGLYNGKPVTREINNFNQ